MWVINVLPLYGLRLRAARDRAGKRAPAGSVTGQGILSRYRYTI
jgi:hypothetical protein